MKSIMSITHHENTNVNILFEKDLDENNAQCEQKLLFFCSSGGTSLFKELFRLPIFLKGREFSNCMNFLNVVTPNVYNKNLD